ncbi:MAG: MoaD family protein [Actinomycetota bacterium]|jgi:MoaD family protein|nr:MoaD family protein [Actinomycetota bacterium]
MDERRARQGGDEEMPLVKLYATLRKAAGEKEYPSQARTVGQVLEELRERYGDGVIRYLRGCIVLVNGQNIGYLKGKRTKLKAEDEVSIFPPLAGG